MSLESPLEEEAGDSAMNTGAAIGQDKELGNGFLQQNGVP